MFLLSIFRPALRHHQDNYKGFKHHGNIQYNDELTLLIS